MGTTQSSVSSCTSHAAHFVAKERHSDQCSCRNQSRHTSYDGADLRQFGASSGELVEGWDVAVRINQLSIGKPENTAGRDEGAVIVDAGQLRPGDPIQLPDDDKQATAM
jgi:hypothetical protein